LIFLFKCISNLIYIQVFQLWRKIFNILHFFNNFNPVGHARRLLDCVRNYVPSILFIVIWKQKFASKIGPSTDNSILQSKMISLNLLPKLLWFRKFRLLLILRFSIIRVEIRSFLQVMIVYLSLFIFVINKLIITIS